MSLAREPDVREVPFPAGLHACEKYLGRCDLPRDGRDLNVAVSGGPDSLALLVLAVASGCTVTAFHVDHGQRDGSHLEAERVAEVAARFGAGYRSESVTVDPGPNLEARMREARFAVLPAGIATGHTADDQAETILLNLVRGSGIDGLSGMRRGSVHPILRLRRHETHALCREIGLVPFVDPSNGDPSFRRNRVRHEVMPLLDEIAGRDVTALMARQAELIAEECAFLDDLARSIDPTEVAQLASAPRALARRAVRLWLASVEPRGYFPGAAAVDRVLAVASGDAIGCEIAGGIAVRRKAGRLRIEGEVR